MLTLAVVDGVFDGQPAVVGACAPWLGSIRRSILLDIVNPPMLAQKTASALHDAVGLSFTGVAVREASGLYAMHGVAGGKDDRMLRQIRLSAGQGLGGKVISLHRSVAVTDYMRDPAISAHFRHLALREDLTSMAAVPVFAGSDVVALLYAATRHDTGEIGAQAILRMEQAATGLADLIATAVRHDDAVRQAAAAQRIRIAEELHDRLGQLIFGIGAAAHKLRPDARDEFNASEVGREIEGQAKQAASYLRDALRLLGPKTPEETLPVAMRIDVEAFSQRSGIPTQLVLLGEPKGILPEDEAALLAVVREALHNVEKHARASMVLVTLDYEGDVVRVVVQDDGRGLPAGFVLPALPSAADGWGLPSIVRQIQQRGGHFQIGTADEGGTTVRASIHCSLDV